MHFSFLGYIDPQTPAMIPSLLAAAGGVLLISWHYVRGVLGRAPTLLRGVGQRLRGRKE